MNLEYLKNEILPVREQEIKDGKNLMTPNPIYLVYSLRDMACEGHSEYLGATNNKGKEPEHGYIDRAESEPDFELTDKGMENPAEVTQFWIDEYKAIFLTSEAAHEYCKYQAHNMNEPYVFVHHTGYSNHQMESLFKKR
jgi:hypothetical protein